MNVNQYVLSALTSAAIFVAAPISAKDIIDPVDFLPSPAAVADAGHAQPGALALASALDYALRIEAEAERLSIFGGVPGMPVVLAVGFDETHVLLPGEAVLRLDPLAVLPLKRFDFDGECHVFFERQPVSVEIFELFFQAVSMADGEKFCTSELMWLRTDLAGHWEFQNRN